MKRVTKREIAERVGNVFRKYREIKNQTSDISTEDFIEYLCCRNTLAELNEFWVPESEALVNELDDTERLMFECMD